ncbi:solute symporter family protein [Streptantibioticus silvisoli]|uniref:Cation acetate symporter n=1 Tax=Streptantibioticus silvisoli TaxID=2705255 RepID=A0ABT6W6K4_9ACTN|nr:cation acetate symporter [Streptantibioticus silvisoli]MDI5966380.1 cation acetate symporter [Streptantibioticus silvisoli]
MAGAWQLAGAGVAVAATEHRGLALGLFTAFVAVTLAITVWAGRRRRSSEEFFSGGRLFSPLENGLAISGDYLSAGSFLGVSGLIALYGYDGVLYLVGFLVAWLGVLLLVAELVRNCGRFTLADVLSARMRERPVRIAAGTSSITVAVLYLVAQMVGAGSLVSLLAGGTSAHARTWAVVGVGALMVVYVAFGGMRATTWVQIVKSVLLLGGTVALTVMVLARFHGNVNDLLRSAAHGSGHGAAYLRPGLKYGGSWTARLDFVSLGLALVLGTAGLPHIVSRFYTVPTARAARRSAVWAVGLIGTFYLMTMVLGLGAAALVGSGAVRASNAAGNTAVPLLALRLGGGAGSTGGTVLFAVVGSIAFATILAVVAGLTLSSSASVAHDLYGSLRRRSTERRTAREDTGEVRVARFAAVGIGAVAIGLTLLAQELNTAVVVGVAFAVAASANVPALLYTLFWRRFTTRGTVWAIYGGLLPAVVLVAFSPVVSGSPDALLPGMDFHWFPLQNPGIVSIPLGFLAGWLGTVLSREPADPGRHAELEVRSLTGAGAV